MRKGRNRDGIPAIFSKLISLPFLYDDYFYVGVVHIVIIAPMSSINYDCS